LKKKSKKNKIEEKNCIFAAEKCLKKFYFMNTYQIQINESVPLGQSITALLRSATEVVFFNVQETGKIVAQNNKLQKSLRSGFNDVREIIDGKQKRTTIDEFINELRNNTNQNI